MIKAMQGGPERVAGGVTMSKKASTAALETFSQRTHQNQRRVPGHEAKSKEAKKQRSKEAKKRGLRAGDNRPKSSKQGFCR
jgi:hypothetical protein